MSVGDITFECKLIPKGNGNYLIPVSKKMLSFLTLEEEYEICIEPIETLSRINHDSPYSRETPVRIIDGIEEISAPTGYCGHSCVAMLAGVSLSEVIEVMGKERASWSKILEAMDYYGISYAPKAVYTKGKNCLLPKCCIINNNNTFRIWYNGSFCGTDDIDPKKTISYIEVFTD